MKIKTFSLFLLFSFAFALLSCSSGGSSKQPYQKPTFENGDKVLVRAYKTEFMVAEVCATKTAGKSSPGSCSYQASMEDIKKLKEDQVMIVGCEVGLQKSAPFETDEIILIESSKGSSPNTQPPVEPGDIVIVPGMPGGFGCGTLFPAVKVVKVEGLTKDNARNFSDFNTARIHYLYQADSAGQVHEKPGKVYFTFLSKNNEEQYTQAKGRMFSDAPGQAGVYYSNEWYIPSPKLAEILKKP
jgi:hypothetical protein